MGRQQRREKGLFLEDYWLEEGLPVLQSNLFLLLFRVLCLSNLLLNVKANS